MAEPPLTGSKTKLVFERLPAPIPAGGWPRSGMGEYSALPR